MNQITEISKPTQWKAGQSGNPNGRPVGTRQAFSAGFLKDLAEVWQEKGKQAMNWTADNQQAVFFATCARLLPSEVRATIEQAYNPLGPDELAILQAIKQSLPDANSKSPEAILKFVEEAVREKAARPAIDVTSEGRQKVFKAKPLILFDTIRIAHNLGSQREDEQARKSSSAAFEDYRQQVHVPGRGALRRKCAVGPQDREYSKQDDGPTQYVHYLSLVLVDCSGFVGCHAHAEPRLNSVSYCGLRKPQE